MAEADYYAALGIARTADADAVRSAYRRLARQYHPDVNPGDAEAEERFKEISRAYDVLSDDKKRALYDEFGPPGLEPGFDPEAARHWGRRRSGDPFGGAGFGGGSFNLEDLFAGMGGPSRPMRGRDQSAPIDVGFLDAVLSREVRVSMGGGDTLRVKLPPGAKNGTRVRLAGKGEPGPRGGPPGDLFLVLRVGKHERFRRSGDDIEVELPLSVPQWIRGGSVAVATPEGSAQLQVPPRAPVDKRLRLRGKGATRRRGGRGHLLVTLVPRLPDVPDVPDGQGEALEAIAAELDALYGDAAEG